MYFTQYIIRVNFNRQFLQKKRSFVLIRRLKGLKYSYENQLELTDSEEGGGEDDLVESGEFEVEARGHGDSLGGQGGGGGAGTRRERAPRRPRELPDRQPAAAGGGWQRRRCRC